MKKILKLKTGLNKKYKILISGGILLSSGAITGSFVYKFIFANKINTLNKDDVINLDWKKVAQEAISFTGQNGSGVLKYNDKNISDKIVPKFTAKNPQQQTFQDKDFKFNITAPELKNLANGDIIYLKFFAINPSKNSLSKELRSNFKLEVNGLKPKPIDFSSELSKLKQLDSAFTSSQLYDKFHNRQKDSDVTLNELKILSASQITFKDNVDVKYKFLKWNYNDNHLEIKTILTLKDPKSDLEYENNEKIIEIIPSNDYSFVQDEINVFDANTPIFDYAENSIEDPNDWDNNGYQWPSDFSLEKFYGYSLPSTISKNIKINEYTNVEWNDNNQILSVTANIIDKKAPKDFGLQHKEVNINIKLYGHDQILDTPLEVVNKLKDDASESNPAQSNLNYSQLKNLFVTKGKDFELEAEEFGYHDFPMAKKLQDDYFIESWDDTNKLLKIKVKVRDTSDPTIAEQEAIIYIKGSNNLNPEKQKISDFLFNNRVYYTNKTKADISTFFAGKTQGDTLDLVNPTDNWILDYSNPSNLTKGINVEFEYIGWNEVYNVLDLKVILTDDNAKSTTTFENNELQVSIKLIPRYDFQNDLDKFPNDTNKIFNSSLSYAELFDKFNENNGTEARKQGDAISPGSFGFSTPQLSKSSIKANYSLEEWNNTTKKLKVKVTLEDTDSPGVTFTNNTKTFTINGSKNIEKELDNVENFYTVFAAKNANDINSHFSEYQVGRKFDFTNEFPSLAYQEPSLTPGIILNYEFMNYDYDSQKLTIRAKVKDSHAPSGSSASLHNYKDIEVQIVPAYDYAKIVQKFNETVPKQINTLNGSQLYDIFYDDQGTAKYQKGEIIDPDIFGYKNRILLPKNIDVKYKFNSWDVDNNLLKIDVSLKNNDIPDLIKQLGEDFTLEFYGNFDLQNESEKIKTRISNPFNYEMFINIPDQENWVNENMPLNKEFTLQEFKDILDKKSYRSDIEDLIDNSGISHLSKGIQPFISRTGMQKDSGHNLVLNFTITLRDKYMYKIKNPQNNIINNFKIRINPKFNIDFLSNFIYNYGVIEPTSLNPRGEIDLRGIKEIMDSLKKYRPGWDWSPGKVDPNESHTMGHFFSWIFGWNNYGQPGHWSLENTFKYRNLIDPNTGKIVDEDDYVITVRILGYDSNKKAVITKISFKLKESAKQKHQYPSDMIGDEQIEVWRELYWIVGD